MDGFELDVVEAAVRRSLAAAEELATPDVVISALCVGAVRGAWQAWRGAIPLRDLPAWMALDMIARGGLAAAGAKAGAFAGLVALGPAGAVVLGPAIGAASQFGAGRLRKEAESVIRSGWNAEVAAAAARLQEAYARALARRVEGLSRRAACGLKGAAILDWLAARAVDDAAFAAGLEADLDASTTDERGARRLLAEVRREAPTDAGCLAAGHALLLVLERRPGIMDSIESELSTWTRPWRRT